jgi:hypothetical protein
MKLFKRFLPVLLGMTAVFFTACEKDVVETFHQPVVNTDFTVNVQGNQVILSCTMGKATGFLWEMSNGVQSTQKKDTIYVPLKGSYGVKLSVSNGGDYLTSDSILFEIAATDVEYYNTGIWKALTGGSGATKVWKLDIGEVVTTKIDDAGNVTTSSVKKSSYFHNALDFYGDADAGGATGSWGPWGGTSIYDWGGTPEDGEISFDANAGTVKLVIDGVTTNGTYTFNPYDRIADFCNPAIIDNGTAITLWENMLKYKYNYLGTLSAQMGDIKFSSGLRFPLDKGRMTNDGNTTNTCQFKTEDLENVVIMHCTDSAMIVRVKRSYEGANSSLCWLLYNFVVKGLTYSAPTYTHPVKTNITTATLAGSWKTATVPYNWVGWPAKNLLNTWTTGADMIATGWAATAASLVTDAALRISFATNGTCVINGKSTTYTIKNGGYLAFADSVSIPTYIVKLAGKNMYAVDVTGSTDGLWLGQNNGDKAETSAVHFVKE